MKRSGTVDDGGSPSAERAALGARVMAKLERNPMVERIANPHVDVFWRNDFLTPAECAEMRALIEAGATPSTLFSKDENPDYRTSSSCHLDPYDPFVTGISDRIVALMGIDRSFGETIQGQRYQPGQEYREHCDWFGVTAPFWPRMRKQGGQRVWTAMIYLNAVEEGGETIFPHCGFMVSPREGGLLMWSNLDREGAPNPWTLHAAKPVVRGAKYVLTKWFRERAWTP